MKRSRVRFSQAAQVKPQVNKPVGLGFVVLHRLHCYKVLLMDRGHLDIAQTPKSALVIWLNGAFGAGKTTTARHLMELIPGAVLFDPEEVGSMLRQVLQQVAPVRDFQEWGAWRELTAASLASIANELPEEVPRVVIVPQTITDETYWSQIRELLPAVLRLVPISLYVDREEHHRRATNDTEEPGALRWRLVKFDQFANAEWIRREFHAIDTSELTPVEVRRAVESVLADAGVPTVPE